jgi:DNA polymerase-4
MKKIPMGILSRRFGPLGQRIWLMAQGRDPAAVESRTAPPKSLGHSKVIPPDTRDRDTLITMLEQMAFKVAARLRRHRLTASRYEIGLRSADGWLGGRYAIAATSANTRRLMALARQMIDECWHGEGIFQCRITALDPQPEGMQTDLIALLESFDEPEEPAVDRLLDQVNDRYGEYALHPARLLRRNRMPNVIAPAWKPDGHRQTIQE